MRVVFGEEEGEFEFSAGVGGAWGSGDCCCPEVGVFVEGDWVGGDVLGWGDLEGADFGVYGGECVGHFFFFEIGMEWSGLKGVSCFLLLLMFLGCGCILQFTRMVRRDLY